MTATIELAFVVFGLALLFWAITATDKSPGRRAAGASIGIAALIIGILAALARPRDDWEDRS
jgi:hypothetical protein